MSTFTAEISWLVPSGLHITVEADDPAAALAEANRMINADEIDFTHQKEWGDASSSTEVTGLWAGPDCYRGADLRTPEELFRADLDLAREVAPLAAERMADALNAAERFISGFEGDESQEGIDELLAIIRSAIGGAA